ncbi:type IV secretion protein Rhs [Streptomyces cadmiisoli]|uniref:Type IV secretion protein Rhs n=3 Tax=Streptomyces TaxID=1883 RepID=A0A2Z4IQF3_9ACTN|nr:type IV secretion protein Rhs [Streptomyces cadmiisoli]AWW42058.1 type IV secretion protein Rhs [Streptomyces cadmiisoli]
MVPMTNRKGENILNPDGTRVMTREYVFTRGGGDRVIIQDHSYGHYYGEGGVGDQGAHFNVRPYSNPRTGKVPGTAQHYEY